MICRSIRAQGEGENGTPRGRRVGMPPGAAALDRWRTRTPLLIIGSHAWNTPYNDHGHITAGHEQQPRVLKAAHGDGWAGRPSPPSAVQETEEEHDCSQPTGQALQPLPP